MIKKGLSLHNIYLKFYNYEKKNACYSVIGDGLLYFGESADELFEQLFVLG